MAITPTAWMAVHNPAAATQATISKAAPIATKRHVVTHIHATLAGTAATTAPLHVYLRDGAAGAGTIVWSAVLSVPINGFAAVSYSGAIPLTPGNAATLEFEGAGAANTTESVTMHGRTE